MGQKSRTISPFRINGFTKTKATKTVWFVVDSFVEPDMNNYFLYLFKTFNFSLNYYIFNFSVCP